MQPQFMKDTFQGVCRVIKSNSIASSPEWRGNQKQVTHALSDDAVNNVENDNKD
jgi:hypothetical protein